MTADALFAHIERLHGDAAWGRVLDAGTGRTSLRWVCSLPSERWTAVTGDSGRARALERSFGAQMRPGDRVLCGNWTDPVLLHGEAYDVVLADYLLGALEAHAPYYQDRLFGRLRPLVAGRLYCVGLTPYPDEAPHPWGAAVLEVARLRDACRLLAGERAFREYPADWVVRALERSGYMVEDVHCVPIRYGARFVNEELEVAVRALQRVADRELADPLQTAIDRARARALALQEAGVAQSFGEDWVVCARPR